MITHNPVHSNHVSIPGTLCTLWVPWCDLQCRSAHLRLLWQHLQCEASLKNLWLLLSQILSSSILSWPEVLECTVPLPSTRSFLFLYWSAVKTSEWPSSLSCHIVNGAEKTGLFHTFTSKYGTTMPTEPGLDLPTGATRQAKGPSVIPYPWVTKKPICMAIPKPHEIKEFCMDIKTKHAWIMGTFNRFSTFIWSSPERGAAPLTILRSECRLKRSTAGWWERSNATGGTKGSHVT